MKKASAFWDSSALVPLCANQRTSPQAQRYYRKLSLVVWWSTIVEVRSAICRLHRTRELTDQEQRGAFARLHLLSNAWREVLPDDRLRDSATDALDRYALSAADALQLAAALIWCKQHPAGRPFITADLRLAEAARSVGFSVVAFP